jgi:hypothetical protein
MREVSRRVLMEVSRRVLMEVSRRVLMEVSHRVLTEVQVLQTGGVSRVSATLGLLSLLPIG